MNRLSNNMRESESYNKGYMEGYAKGYAEACAYVGHTLVGESRWQEALEKARREDEPSALVRLRQWLTTA